MARLPAKADGEGAQRKGAIEGRGTARCRGSRPLEEASGEGGAEESALWCCCVVGLLGRGLHRSESASIGGLGTLWNR